MAQNVDISPWYIQVSTYKRDGAWPNNERSGGAPLDLSLYSLGTVFNFGHGGNTSGVCYNSAKDTILTIQNGSRTVTEYNVSDMSLVRSIAIPSVDNDSDLEGIVHLGGTTYAVSSEGGSAYRIGVIEIADGATVGTVTCFYVLAASGADNNSGLEDLCYDAFNRTFYAVGEGQQVNTPRRFFKLIRPTNETTSYSYLTDPELQAPNLTEPFDPEVAFSAKGATGAEFDLSGIAYHAASGNVLVLSHTGDEVIEVNPATGAIISSLLITNMTQPEGVCILSDGNVLIVGEADEYQLVTKV